MQFYALEEGVGPVCAASALRRRDYRCPECQGVLRLRKGPHRQPHFFHRAKTSLCRQHQKGPCHLHAQQRILAELPRGEGAMELAFPAIGRIADVAWPSRKLVFEIQCSPIRAEEVSARNAHYASLGYAVVWILHIRTFNRQKMSAAELLLLKHPHYFTNIDWQGKGMIFDQFTICRGAYRLFKGPPCPVEIACLKTLQSQRWEAFRGRLPEVVRERLVHWKSHLQGDLLDRLLEQGETSLRALIVLEKSYQRKGPPFSRLKQWAQRTFTALLKKTFS